MLLTALTARAGAAEIPAYNKKNIGVNSDLYYLFTQK